MHGCLLSFSKTWVTKILCKPAEPADLRLVLGRRRAAGLAPSLTFNQFIQHVQHPIKPLQTRQVRVKSAGQGGCRKILERNRRPRRRYAHVMERVRIVLVLSRVLVAQVLVVGAVTVPCAEGMVVALFRIENKFNPRIVDLPLELVPDIRGG